MLDRIFDMENPFFRFLSRVADLMILNIIFLITCIPIVTIGAAWTGLYYMTLKMVRNEESYIIRGYLKSFKQNFKQATLMWIAILFFLIMLFLDFNIMATATGTMANIIRVGITMIAVFVGMVLMYLFPVLSKFYNSIKNTFKNAFLMSVRHLPQTVIMLVVTIAAGLVTFLNTATFIYGLLIWLMMGFAIVAYINSKFLVRIFDNYIPEEDTEDSAEEVTEDDFMKEIPEEISKKEVPEEISKKEVPEEDSAKDSGSDEPEKGKQL